MEYRVEFKPRASKDLAAIQPEMARRIVERIIRLQDNLEGDVKKLTNFMPSYRLSENNRVVVYRVVHRREVYR